jgi:cell shape-determining protein MreC
MTYLRPSTNRDHSSRKTKIAYGILIAVVLFGFLFSQLAYLVGGPMWTVREAISNKIVSIGSYFKWKASLQNENNDLKKKLDEKNAEIITIKNQVDLYKQLDSYIALKDTKANESIVRVVTRPPQTPFDVLLIEAKDEAIKAGQKVFFAGVPVGYIESKTGSYARVFLFSHSSSQFRVLVGADKVEADAKGKSQGNIYLTLPKSVVVNTGDTVYLADGTVPIGTVSKIDNNTSTSFIDVYVKMPFSPSKIDFLTVLKE